MSTVLTLPMASWPTARKVAAVLFTLIGFAALVMAALYLSAVLFLVFSKANPRLAGWNSILDYWQLYADVPVLRRRLVTAIGMANIATLIVFPGALYAASRPRRALHGDARFASTAEVKRAGLLLPDQNTNTPSVLIGRFRGQFLALPGQQVQSPGTAKPAAAAIPDASAGRTRGIAAPAGRR